ncbi:MAG: 3-oxoacid CoA-transferase subunit A [Betaproteobacteria bacterium]
MVNKLIPTLAQAVADVPDGATVMIGGFGTAGLPNELTEALIEQGARDLVIVNNNAGNGETGLAALIKARRVRKIICSFPRQVDSHHFDSQYRSGELELELVPQGNLAERIRAAGAGIGAFFTPTGYGTPLAEGKETRISSLRPDDKAEGKEIQGFGPQVLFSRCILVLVCVFAADQNCYCMCACCELFALLMPPCLFRFCALSLH